MPKRTSVLAALTAAAPEVCSQRWPDAQSVFATNAFPAAAIPARRKPDGNQPATLNRPLSIKRALGRSSTAQAAIHFPGQATCYAGCEVSRSTSLTGEERPFGCLI